MIVRIIYQKNKDPKSLLKIELLIIVLKAWFLKIVNNNWIFLSMLNTFNKNTLKEVKTNNRNTFLMIQ